MKKLSEITNEILHTLTLTAAKSEKVATLTLLEHLAEIDRRRLYAEKSYPSLWLYVHEFLGYSESQTSERVGAMRLMVKIPDVKKELESEKISLTTAAKLATHVRREKTGTSETLKLLAAISGKSAREVDQHLAKNSLVEYHMDKQKVVTPETTRIIIDVDHDFLALMERIRELKGHQGSSTQELLKLAMNNFVKRHELTLRTPKVQENSNAFNSNSLTSQSRYISAKIRNEIRARSGDQCEYVDSVTKRRCQCRIKLEFDHVIPYALGGQTSFENLRHYCSAHNKLSAIRHFGQLHMNPFLKN